MSWAAIVVAAGRGTRFGRPKQLLDLAGQPMLGWSLQTFGWMPEIEHLVVVTEAPILGQVEALARARAEGKSVAVVPGGASRQQSVRAGLAALPTHASLVLVHDGARPLIRATEVRAGMRVVGPGVGALLAVPVVDTIKLVDTSTHRVIRTLDRSSLWAAQTPQFATTRDLRRAHADAERCHVEATDDAALLERVGVDVVCVASSPENFKVTLPGDLARAEAILRERAPVLPTEQEIYLMEAFVAPDAVDRVLHELTGRSASIDGIDRDLPGAVAIRAYIPAERLRGFDDRFRAVAGKAATYTTRFSHSSPRAS